MNEAEGGDGRLASTAPSAVRRRLWLAAVLLVATGLLGGLVLVGLSQQSSTPPALTPEADLSARWGTYVSERSWGTPREAVGDDGWGLSWRGAIDTPYNFADDGIAGVSDVNSEFRLSWAFWDGRADHVTERFYGVSNPQGASGQAIVDDRVMLENTANHGYARMDYRYPSTDHAFDVQLEFGKLDSTHMVMAATATNATDAARTLDVVLRASTIKTDQVKVIDGGFLLSGDRTAVAVVADPASGWQISPLKDALDTNLRAGSLTGDAGGNLAALDFKLQLPARATRVVHVAFDEVPLVDTDSAGTVAHALLARVPSVLAARRAEAASQFTGAVGSHQALYSQALMSLLWNESYYRWDGTSGVNPAWAGLVDAHDVLIMPDKWEYPYFDSWAAGFEALTAALVDPTLAEAQLRFMFSDRWQQPDGHVPCSEWAMDQECPPIFAYVTWQLYEQTHDTSLLEDLYPRLQLQYDYWWQHNQLGDALFGGGFMGMDNLPRGNGPQADSSAWMAFFARDMVRIATELRDTAGAERYWTDRGRIQKAINDNLWDEQTGFYYDLDATGSFIADKSYSGLVPLIAGVVPAERIPVMLAALRDPTQLLSPAGIRSTSAAAADYLPGEAGQGVNSNWRGPVWLPLNYLLIDRLGDIDPPFADDLRTRVVTAVEADWSATGRLHEYFDGDTGAGLGADEEAGWTALVANLIAQGWPAPK